MTQKTRERHANAQDMVLACVDALNREDFAEARKHIRDDFSFVGVMGSRNGADAYFRDMEQMKVKYAVKKVFVDGPDVCLLYDVTLSGTSIFGCVWYQVEDEKIRSLRVVFDPRPLLREKVA
jgi:predicted ester cyclase